MKPVLLSIVTLLFSASSFAWSAQEQKAIDALVDAGNPQLQSNHNICANKSMQDLLVYRPYANNPGVCVSLKKLPKNVLQEVLFMEEEQTENESDYDSRITKVYVIETDGVLSYKNGFSDFTIGEMKKTFSIPESAKMTFEMMAPVNSVFKMLPYYLTYGQGGFDVEDTYIGQYLKDQMRDETGIHFEFTEEIGLYPGGGINATYHIFTMDKKIVYLKMVWWNS